MTDEVREVMEYIMVREIPNNIMARKVTEYIVVCEVTKYIIKRFRIMRWYVKFFST